MKKTYFIVGLIIVILTATWFIFQKKNQSPVEQIGEFVEDQGRDHTADIYGIAYTSNPPSSGPHFPIWAKPGVYDRLISDGYFIHSMEHGYIVIWYNCDKLNTSFKIIPEVYAHEDVKYIESDPTATFMPLMHMADIEDETVSWITPENQPDIEVNLSSSFQTDSCKSLVEELKPFLNTVKRVIIAPRVNLDTKLAITAWNRMLKLDTIDKEKMSKFIKTYHNKGPEQTME